MPKFLDDIIAVGGSKVGIGTTSPLAKLHATAGSSGVSSVDTGTSMLVESNTTNYLRFVNPDNQTGGLVWTSPSDNFAAFIRWKFDDRILSIATAKTNSHIDFFTGNTDQAMRIDSSQRVGIGTTSPSAKLDVVGEVQATSLDINGNADISGTLDVSGETTITNGDNGSVKALIIGGAGNNTLQTRHIEGKLHNSEGYDTLYLNYYSNDPVYFGGHAYIEATNKLYLDSGSNTYITESSADNISFFTGGTERLKIDNNGQILASWRFVSEMTTTNSLFQAKYNSTNFLEIGYNFINVQGGDYTLKRGGTERIKVTASGIEVNGEVQVTGDIRNINSYQQGTVSAANPAMKAVLLAHSTESNGAVIHPYLFNDLANFRKRGGTITYGGLSSNPSDAASDIMFQASALTCSINNGVITGSTWTIELKDFPRTLFYGTRIGISFGSVSFAPSSMLVQYSSDNGANYTTALTSSVRSEYYHTYVANGGSGTGINAIKFTIGKFNTHSPRVMNIYAYNYDSRGMTEYFLDKAGGTLYGNLTMNSAGFTLDGNTITGIDNASEFTDDDNHIMTSAAIKNKIADNDNNFITASSLPTDFVSKANGGTFAGNVAFTGNITANGNINGDGSTNVGNMNNVTAVKLLANGLSLKIGDQQGASITMGKEPTVVSGVTQNDATDVVIANNLTVTKKLLIQGELETETTTNTVIKDNVIQLNDGGNSANTKDSGIVIHRGTSQNVAIVWDEDGQTAGGAFRFIATGDTASSADVSMTPQNELGENVIGGASALGFQDVYAAHFRAVGAGNTSGFVGDGSGVTNLNMGNASSGTLAAARGGTGLSSISTLLNSNVTSVSGSSGSCTGNAATATAFSTTLGLTTVSMTFQLAANTWTDTGINSSDLTSGTYAMQVYVDDHNAGGLHYDEYYSATISWFGGTTNSSNHDEIVTHNAGHANNTSHLQFRTLRHTNPGDNLMLQVKQNFAHSLALNGTDGKTMTFKFRRLI